MNRDGRGGPLETPAIELTSNSVTGSPWGTAGSADSSPPDSAALASGAAGSDAAGSAAAVAADSGPVAAAGSGSTAMPVSVGVPSTPSGAGCPYVESSSPLVPRGRLNSVFDSVSTASNAGTTSTLGRTRTVLAGAKPFHAGPS